MSTRKFTVFIDEPTTTKRPLSRSHSAAAVLTSRSENVSSSRTVLGTLPEKENIHPVTGNSSTSSQTSKKRKASDASNVLATKAFTPVSIEAKPKRTEAKRKLSSSKVKGQKESSKRAAEPKKVLGATKVNHAPLKRAPSAPSRSSVVTLDAVPEEAEEKPIADKVGEGETRANNISQAQIDERCYELTVSPLADVSGAYLQSAEYDDEAVKNDLPEYRIVKEESCFSSQIRDYFSPEGSRTDSLPSLTSSVSLTSSLFGSFDALCSQGTTSTTLADENEEIDFLPTTPTKKLKRTASTPNTPKEMKEARESIEPLKLSTPERKQLYATFTFMTPTTSPVKSK